MEQRCGKRPADATQVHTHGRRGCRRHPAMMTPVPQSTAVRTRLVVMVTQACTYARFLLLLPWRAGINDSAMGCAKV